MGFFLHKKTFIAMVRKYCRIRLQVVEMNHLLILNTTMGCWNPWPRQAAIARMA